MNLKSFAWIGLALPLTLAACGDGEEDTSPSSMTSSPNSRILAAEAPTPPLPTYPLCNDNILWIHEGKPHQNCSVDLQRCSCNPWDNHGYYDCLCVPRRYQIEPEVKEKLKVAAGEKWMAEDAIVFSGSPEAGSKRFPLTGSKCSTRQREPEGRLHCEMKGVMTDLGPLKLGQLCEGTFAQLCAIGLETSPGYHQEPKVDKVNIVLYRPNGEVYRSIELKPSQYR